MAIESTPGAAGAHGDVAEQLDRVRLESDTLYAVINAVASSPDLDEVLDGIENELDPGDPTTELNLHELTEDQRNELGVELLPANLLDATRELEADEVLRRALGHTGREDYVDYFVREKREEFKDWHDQVSRWEIDRYLQLF